MNTQQIFDYLKEKIPDFKLINKRGQVLFTCPCANKHKFPSPSPTMTPLPNSDKFYCLICGIKIDLKEMICLVENKQLSDIEIVNILNNKFESTKYPELDNYQKYGWYLLPIASNSKVPLKEFHWKEESYNEKSKWIQILDSGYNIAVACGKSNIMIIDFDSKEVSPESLPLRDEIQKLLDENDTLIQKSARGGRHYIFKIDEELCFKQKVDIGGLKIDTRTHKGYFIVSPSKYEGKSYEWVNLGHEIKDISLELKNKLLSIIKEKKEPSSPELSEEAKKIIDNPIELTSNNLEGRCNDTFVRFGGALLKMGISHDNIKIILHYLNKHWLKSPMPNNAVDGMLGSLEGYKETEETTQERAIYECCELIATDISAKDIMEHTGLKRAIVDKILAKFHKDGNLTRRGRGRYDIRQKVEWTNDAEIKSSELKYKIPYFDEVAYFRNGDIILIGAPTGKGKTTIAMNFIKQIKNQGIIPYYISLEAGSRYEKTANQLGMTVKDFYVPKTPVVNPTQIEIEPNAFTIVDWLYTGDDFSATQAVFKYLNDEMVRKGGILIVFTQLKEDYNWFAPNLVKSFPRFATRFIFDDEIGILSHFDVCKITDPKGHYQTAIINTEFNFDTKEIKKKNNI